MDKWDYIDKKRRRNQARALIWNLLTVFLLLSTVCMVCGFGYVFLDPNSGFNPFPPPTMPVALEFPTPTPTPRGVLPVTWTPIPSSTPIPPTILPATNTLPPPSTPTITETNPVFTASVTPSLSVTAGGLPFGLNNGSPVAISSLAFHPEAGCNWMGVSGQVLNMSGAPVSTGIVIQLGGSLDGVQKAITSISGTARQYGESGYEIVLASKPIVSQGTLWIQLLDQAGLPMSAKVFFDTFSACDKNLIFLTFRQFH